MDNVLVLQPPDLLQRMQLGLNSTLELLLDYFPGNSESSTSRELLFQMLDESLAFTMPGLTQPSVGPPGVSPGLFSSLFSEGLELENRKHALSRMKSRLRAPSTPGVLTRAAARRTVSSYAATEMSGASTLESENNTMSDDDDATSISSSVMYGTSDYQGLRRSPRLQASPRGRLGGGLSAFVFPATHDSNPDNQNALADSIVSRVADASIVFDLVYCIRYFAMSSSGWSCREIHKVFQNMQSTILGTSRSAH